MLCYMAVKMIMFLVPWYILFKGKSAPGKQDIIPPTPTDTRVLYNKLVILNLQYGN